MGLLGIVDERGIGSTDGRLFEDSRRGSGEWAVGSEGRAPSSRMGIVGIHPAVFVSVRQGRAYDVKSFDFSTA